MMLQGGGGGGLCHCQELDKDVGPIVKRFGPLPRGWAHCQEVGWARREQHPLRVKSLALVRGRCERAGCEAGGLEIVWVWADGLWIAGRWARRAAGAGRGAAGASWEEGARGPLCGGEGRWRTGRGVGWRWAEKGLSVCWRCGGGHMPVVLSVVGLLAVGVRRGMPLSVWSGLECV